MLGVLRRTARVVTPLGWFVAALVVLACGLYWLAGWLEALTAAIVGLVCLVAAVLSLLGRGRLTVEVTLPQRRTRIGNTAFGEIRIRNQSPRRSRASVVELPIGQGLLPVVVPALGPGEEFEEVFGVPALARGVVPLGPARSVRSDSLGLLSAARHWNQREDLYIHPTTVRIPFDATGFHNDVEGVVTAHLSSSDVSFHAMRDYSPGDDPRHIHWPTTARTGRLSVRHYEETRRSHHVIVLETGLDVWPDDSFELGVSIAASMALAGLLRGRKVDVITSQGALSATTPVGLLDALTEVDPALAPPFPEVVAQAVHRNPSLSALTVVCAPTTSDEQRRSWTRIAGPDVLTSIIQAQPGAPTARRRVGDALMVTCPNLDELPRLMQGS